MSTTHSLNIIFQLQTLGAQNALWQSQLAAAAVANSNNAILGNSAPTVMSPSTPVSVSGAPTVTRVTQPPLTSNRGTLSGFAASDLHALQMALQQQQRTLQQQLQSFLLLQQPSNVQEASAVLLQSQVQQAVSQATSQLKLLQKLDQTKEHPYKERTR